jgi:hypothetical protein
MPNTVTTDPEEIRRFARERLGNIEGLDLDRAHITIDPDAGRTLVAPMAEDPVSNIEELARGATVFGVSIDHAPRSADVRDGSYAVRVSRDRGVWIAEFIQEGQIVVSTTQVRVIETGQRIERPIAFTLDSGIVWFVAGFAVGVVVGIAIAKA